jgi:hypothetical protein
MDFQLIRVAHAAPFSLLQGLDFNSLFSANGLFGVILNLFNLASYAAGIVSVIFVIVGGITYITSAGNEKGIVRAKSTILWAVIGLVISISAVAITTFVITSLNGNIPVK